MDDEQCVQGRVDPSIPIPTLVYTYPTRLSRQGKRRRATRKETFDTRQKGSTESGLHRTEHTRCISPRHHLHRYSLIHLLYIHRPYYCTRITDDHRHTPPPLVEPKLDADTAPELSINTTFPSFPLPPSSL